MWVTSAIALPHDTKHTQWYGLVYCHKYVLTSCFKHICTTTLIQQVYQGITWFQSTNNLVVHKNKTKLIPCHNQLCRRLLYLDTETRTTRNHWTTGNYTMCTPRSKKAQVMYNTKHTKEKIPKPAMMFTYTPPEVSKQLKKKKKQGTGLLAWMCYNHG